jgi:hypothetical protein
VYWYSVSSGAQLKVPCVASTEPHFPSFSGVNSFQYVAKSERMTPCVEMLPTNFLLVEPPLLDPELDPEPELEAEDEEPEPELDPWPDPELDPDEVEGASELESAEVPAPPSSPNDGWLWPGDAQATTTDTVTTGKRRREWEARFINRAVARDSTHH